MEYFVPIIALDGHVRLLIDVERDVYTNAYLRYRGNHSKVSKHLGVPRSTYYRKRKQLFPEEDSRCGHFAKLQHTMKS